MTEQKIKEIIRGNKKMDRLNDRQQFNEIKFVQNLQIKKERINI